MKAEQRGGERDSRLKESFLVPFCPETCPLVQSFLANSDRSFLLHCHTQLKTGLQSQDRHLFLFNDIMVVAKAKSANHFKQKAQVCVCELWMAGCMEEVCEGSTSPERSFVMGWPTCNYVATFSSAEEKERWLSLLKSRIKDEKEKEEPKTIPLRVYGKGISSYAVTKTLPVSNSDSSSEVVRLALQQFGIIGNVREYQLWVISKRDNAPYPLIGHEFPFSIQMSHARHSSQGGSRDDADRQLHMDKHCQFILKPRPIVPTREHVSAESSQKPLKRRRSIINWVFWRGSSSQLELSASLAGAPRGCLFGQPLSSICVEDSLPKPVMDMLAFLYHEGSWTRGIFRRPAGARAVRELRDSLDAGVFHLPLTRDHIFIIAGVFKDFLRSIPGSLLCSELYEEWTDALEEDEEEEEQVQDVQRMVCRLPKENTLLLRYLLAVLHGINGNVPENQMTSFNLSVCIAPSMLWPPGAPGYPEVEGEGTRKVCDLVKFMIDHCQQVLGEDPSSLFGGPPQRHIPKETGSDPWPYPLTDSSYDSLENELDDYSSSSPSVRRGNLRTKPLQGSLDSVLTFSDCDQDPDPDLQAPNPQTANLDGLKSQPLRSSRCVQQDPDTVLPSQDTSHMGTSSALDSPPLESRHRQRRRSEPAIKYMDEFRLCTKSFAGEDEDGEGKPSNHALTNTHSKVQNRRKGCESGSGLDEPSSSSLSSIPQTLDSLSSDQTQQIRQELHLDKKSLPSSGSLSTSLSSTPFTISPALPPGGHPEQGSCPKESPPKELRNWGTLIGSRGLHPNSWLKKDRRLSLNQQDGAEKEEEEKADGGPTVSKGCPGKGKSGEKGGGKQIQPKPSCRGLKEGAGCGYVWLTPGQEPPNKPASSSPPSHHRSTGSLQYPNSPFFQATESQFSLRQLSDIHMAESSITERKHPPQPECYKKTGPTLSLFKQHKSTEEERLTRLSQRRGSEPGRLVMDRASTLFH
ncbi:hypothetical protein LDENG_00187190, partial [Lucifuga dentata]